MTKKPTDVMNLFNNKEIVKICAPMVRYSKLQFRSLVRYYDCDLCFTPMILADSFCKSAKARNNEFTTNLYDVPLITQFAANTVHDFVGAAHIVSQFCNGVDLNCGCPQRWAKQMGLGCKMLEQPEIIYDLVRQCRNRISKPFTVSVKMRLKKDPRKSVEICRQLDNSGVSFLSVHGRTPDQLTGNVNTEALKLIAESVNIPVVSNGGVKNLEDCVRLKEETKCKGVMVANGLLTNPTLFTGTSVTTTECIQKWLDICYNTTLNHRDVHKIPTIHEKPKNLTFQCFHHHLVFMLEKLLTRSERRIFNNLQTFSHVLNFISDRFSLSPHLSNVQDFEKARVLNLDYGKTDDVYYELCPDEVDRGCDLLYNYDSNDGKYFESKINNDDCCDWSDMFLQNG